jgi:8-oxo-dGTP pyrophosphatase MutT (NUDIX family)
MELDFLVDQLKQRLQLSLPGSLAHEALKAMPVGTRLSFKHQDSPRPGSVLILLYEHNGIRFPLIKRPVYSGAHSGQVSFPGGKAEAGEDVYQTALREGHEEIGIDLTQVEVIGRLSEFFVIASNFVVTPIVAVMRGAPAFTPDPFEVAGILSGRLTDIVHDDAILEKEIVVGDFQLRASYFEIEQEVVWGATAMMLNEFRMIIKEIFSAQV